MTSLLASRALAPIAYSTATRARNDLSEVIATMDKESRIPLLRYTAATDGVYLPNSIYPSEHGWNAAGSPPTSANNLFKVSTLLAPPFAAVVALENFYLSSQNTADVDFLEGLFAPLYNYNSYLHGTRLGRIHHPFESGIPLSNPVWETILEQVIADMHASNFTLATPVPASVKASPLYPPTDEVYTACLYLLTLPNPSATWSMTDVFFTAMLTASDVALYQISVVLKDKNAGGVVSSKMAGQLSAWIRECDGRLEALWDPTVGMYAGRVGDGNRTLRDLPSYGSLSEYSSLFGFYSAIREADYETPDYYMQGFRLDSMIGSLLAPDATPTFDCGGRFPYPMNACIEGVARVVDPMTNYFASRGAMLQGAVGVGAFLRNVTIEMVCEKGDTEMCDFRRFYDYEGTQIIADAECPNGNAASAAATVASLLSDTSDFKFDSAPPINNTWVLVIIVCELFVVFGVSVSCLALSVNLFRKLRRERRDEEARGLENFDDHVEFEGLLAFDQSGVFRQEEFGGEEEEEEKKKPGMWSILMSVGEVLSPW